MEHISCNRTNQNSPQYCCGRTKHCCSRTCVFASTAKSSTRRYGCEGNPMRATEKLLHKPIRNNCVVHNFAPCSIASMIQRSGSGRSGFYIDTML